MNKVFIFILLSNHIHMYIINKIFNKFKRLKKLNKDKEIDYFHIHKYN